MDIVEVMEMRAVCPLKAGAVHPECIRNGCAWWTKNGCAVKVLAEKKHE